MVQQSTFTKKSMGQAKIVNTCSIAEVKLNISKQFCFSELVVIIENKYISINVDIDIIMCIYLSI